MKTEISKAKIEIELENIPPKEVAKLRDYFIRLTQAQIHRFGPGKIILHFDKDKNLRKIERHDIPWSD